MAEGEIRLCAHCKGLGICCTVSSKYACLACLNRAGVPMAEAHDHYLEAEGVLCSACEGKGNVWIGPATAGRVWPRCRSERSFKCSQEMIVRLQR